MYSDPVFYSDIAALEKKAQLKKSQVLIFTAIFSYPLWGLFSNYIAPDAYDPIWQRLSFSVLSTFIYSSTYWWSGAEENLSKYYILIWLYSYHLLFLYWMNADSAYYIAYNLIQFPFVLLAFPNLKMAQVYGYTKMIISILFALLVKYNKINPWFFVLSVFTLGHFILTVLKEHFSVVEIAKKSRDVFRLTLMNMLEGVILFDSKGLISSYNNIAEKLLGFNGSSHIGCHYKDTILFTKSFQDDHSPFSAGKNPFERAFKGDETVKNVIMGIDRGEKKEIWIQLNSQHLKESDDFNTVLVSFSDLSLVKKREAEKTQEQAHMAMNARLSSLFAVSGGIAHEINNPLVIIISRLLLLKRKIDSQIFDQEFFNESISKMNLAAKRIANIIEGLKTLTKISDDFPKVPVKLTQILGDTLQLNKENLKEHDIELIVDTIPNVEIECRGVQISQVVLNLLNNSIDAVENQTEKWIKFSIELKNQFVLINVIDSGPGIPENIKHRLMEPFFTTKEIGKGTGLGLSVSKAIIEEHGGRLFLDESCPNTCFTISLKYLS